MNFKIASKLDDISSILHNIAVNMIHSPKYEKVTYTPVSRFLFLVSKILAKPFERLQDKYSEMQEFVELEKAYNCESGCYSCPLGNGEGGCTVPNCEFEDAEHIPITHE